MIDDAKVIQGRRQGFDRTGAHFKILGGRVTARGLSPSPPQKEDSYDVRKDRKQTLFERTSRNFSIFEENGDSWHQRLFSGRVPGTRCRISAGA